MAQRRTTVCDSFGKTSMTVARKSVVVGSYLDDDNGTNTGSAYVFTRSGTAWSEQAKLTASDAAGSDQFGLSVAIDGESVVIGSLFDDDNGASSGHAYVFTRSGTIWSEQAKLTASDAAAFDPFGISVAIDGESIVVGSIFDNDFGDISGSAYVFTRSGTAWSEQAELTASDGAVSDRFGTSVAIDGERVVVGSYLDDDDGSASGSAYVFTRSGTVWSEQAKLTASDAAAFDEFGLSVAIDGESVVVGSRSDDVTSEGMTFISAGSAYVFVVANQSPNIEDGQIFDVDENSDNLTSVGTPVASDPDGDALTYSVTSITSNAGSGLPSDPDGDGNPPFKVDSETGLIIVNDSEDLDFENVTTFSLTVAVDDGNGDTDSSDLTINLNDLEATLAISDTSGLESAGAFAFDVVMTGDDINTVFDVNYSTTDGTAQAVSAGVGSNDYNSTSSGTIAFDGNDLSETQQISVIVNDDDVVEANEDFFVNLLSTTSNDITFTDSQGKGAVNNDDMATLSINDISQVEEESGTINFEFTISSDLTASRDITVVVNTTDLTALAGSDYTAITNQTAMIAAGTTSTIVMVAVDGDALVESDETYNVNLSDAAFDGAADPSRVVIGDGTALGTIENDDFHGGLVFNDLNNDGMFESADGDAGIEGVLLHLVNETTGVVVDDDITDGNGRYKFDLTLPRGTYKIAQVVDELVELGLLDGKETAGVNGGSVDNLQDSNEITGIGVSDSGTAYEQGVDYLFAEIEPSDIFGTVWRDFNEDGEINFGEGGIDGAIVQLTGTDDRGTPVLTTAETQADGGYAHINLRPGSYEVIETQPAGFDDGKESLGEVIDSYGVSTIAADSGFINGNDRFSGIVLVPGSEGHLYNFGERPQAGDAIGDNVTAGIGFWHDTNGEALIESLNGSASSTQLGDWLAATLPDMYGEGAYYDAPGGGGQDLDLTGKSNTYVAEVFQFLHNRNQKTAVAGGPPKIEAQVMALALATYVSSEQLAGGAVAASYGFNTSADGIAYITFNVLDVMSAQEADELGLAPEMDFSGNVTIIDLLQATNARANEGLLYDADGDESIDSFESRLRKLANTLYAAINEGSSS